MTIDSSGANSLAVVALASSISEWDMGRNSGCDDLPGRGQKIRIIRSAVQFAVHRRFRSPAGRRSGPSGWPMHAVFWANPRNRAPRPPLDSTFEGAIGFGPPVLAFPNSAQTEEVCDGGVQADLGGFSHRRA